MKSPRHTPLPTAIAGASILTLVACGIQWLLWPYIPALLWLLFYPAVYISSWVWGIPGGATAATWSVGLAWLIFVPPGNPLNNGAIPTLIFVAMGAMFAIGHESLRKTQRRLQILFAQSADAMVVVARNGRCQTANVAACRLLNEDHAALLATSFFDWVLPQDLDRIHRALDSVQQGSTERLELMLRVRNDKHVPVELSANVLPDGQWLMSLRDISQRKASEEALLQVRSELLEAQRLGKIGSWKWIRDQDRPQWSPEMYRIYAQDPDKPAPPVSELETMYTPSSRQASELALMEALQTGQPYEAERELVLHNGQNLWVNITVEGLLDEHGSIHALRGTAQDITDHKRVELALLQSRRELRDMAAYREQEREQERKAIAREIHDELGQLLAAMRMDVSQLRQRCETYDEVQPILNDLNMLVERTFEVVRSLATSLRPSALDLGLSIALEWLVEDFSLRWDIRCQLHVSGVEVELDDMLSTTIFRVVQESLTNIAKHAKASQVEINMTFSATQVSVTIQDNGQGFDPGDLSRHRNRFGLLGMRERVLALHGQIDITSNAAEGTCIAIEVPIASPLILQP